MTATKYLENLARFFGTIFFGPIGPFGNQLLVPML